jgi:hypothetical protein
VGADFTAVPSLAAAVAAPPDPMPAAPLAAGLDPVPIGPGVGVALQPATARQARISQRRQTSL